MSISQKMDVDYEGGSTKGHKPAPELPKGAADFIQGNLRKILPALEALEDGAGKLFSLATPHINAALRLQAQVSKKLEPYGLKEIGTCVTGLMMMFFGGFFMTTVAVWEAICQGGLDNFKNQLKALYNQYSKFRAANSEDDQEDLDNDGVADVLQISNEQYALRKAMLALRATDPDTISQALHALYTIFIAVLATLQLQFARTISLGASIGDQFMQVYEKVVLPQLELLVSDDYEKWLKPTGNYLCRLLAVSIAFRIQRILSTVHTAIKGGRTFTRGLTALAERNGYGYLTEGFLDEALSAVLAVAGVYMQLFLWTSLPVVIRLLFFPAFFVESVLSFFVNTALSATTLKKVPT